MGSPSVEEVFQDAYGVFVNTKGSTVGNMKESCAGMRILELAESTPTVRHYFWGERSNALKVRPKKLFDGEEGQLHLPM